MQVGSKRLRPKDAAAYIGLSASTLAKLRMRGDGPPYSKVNGRAVVYNLNDIDSWLEQCKRRSTSESFKAE